MKYVIYQATNEMGFLECYKKTWENEKNEINHYDKEDYNYEYVYENDSEKVDLEEVFTKFNINHPKDFKGHSLSVGDVVEVEDGGEKKLFVCDSIGWKKAEWNK